MEKRWPGAPRHPTRCMVTYPPSQVCSFSCKRSTIIYKQLYENLARPGWLWGEGASGPRAHFSPYQQGLNEGFRACGPCLSVGHESPTTVFLKITLTRKITQDKQIVLYK